MKIDPKTLRVPTKSTGKSAKKVTKKKVNKKKKELNPLIKQLYKACMKGLITEPFTTRDVKNLVISINIVKGDGGKYENRSVSSILSNSDINNFGSTNKNIKVMRGREREKRIKEYTFLDRSEWIYSDGTRFTDFEWIDKGG